MNIRKADNMNKKSFFLLLAMLTLNLTACSDSAEEAQQMTITAPNNYTAVSTDTTVSGEVTAIAGNYVTLALGTVEENKDDNSDNNTSDDKSGDNSDMKSDFPDTPNNDGSSTPPEMPDGNMPSGDMPTRDTPEMPSGDFSAPDGAGFGKGGRKSASITKSGEESSYMIPMGMTIDGLSGRSSDYSGITVGTILTLTVSEDGTVRAASAE